MNNKDLLWVLDCAINRFYALDPYLIEHLHKTHEQAVVHRIAHYFENTAAIYNPNFCKEHNFDMEYHPKDIFINCSKCGHKNCSCKKNQKHKEIHPDFLMHKRDSETSNKMITVFNVGKSKREALEYDINKLKYCTCPRSKYKYSLGCFVNINKTGYALTIFLDGKKGKEKFKEFN